ncbi:MAG TPA: hypothetical protein VF058_06615 [Actinomycetota bacterium]
MSYPQRRTRWWAGIAVVAVTMLLATACADTETGDGGEGGTVDVTLQEWSVVAGQDSVAAGPVTFNVTNEGPDHPHELVVIRTDLDPAELPTTDEGAVDEEGEGIEVIGEIEEFPPGETHDATFDLEPGSYVLVCNVVAVAGEHGEGHEEEEEMMEEEGEHEGMEEMEIHYMLGMRAPFTVTG